jgi:inorganic triphosphatase YgiF
LTAAVETELKYSVRDRAAVRDWLDELLPPAGGAEWISRRVLDRYVDTSDGRLARAGYGARLRTGDSGAMVTLKADEGVDGALHRRREIVGRAGSLRPSRWPPGEARDLVLGLAGDAPLIERFVLRQRRLERIAQLDRARVLLSIDHLEVVHAGRLLGTFDGLEVELLEGQPSVLTALAPRLEASGLVATEPRSKLQLADSLVAAARS